MFHIASLLHFSRSFFTLELDLNKGKMLHWMQFYITRSSPSILTHCLSMYHGYDCQVSNKIASYTSCHGHGAHRSEKSEEVKRTNGYRIFDELCYVIERNSAHLIAKNPQIGNKKLKSLYTLRFTIFYVTIHVRLDRPYATDDTLMFVGLRPALEGFVVTMHEGACETGSQIPTA